MTWFGAEHGFVRTDTLTVGPYREGDEPFLWDLYEAAFRDRVAMGRFHDSLWNFGAKLNTPATAVARIDGEPVGFGVIGRVQPSGTTAWLLRVWRYPSMRADVREAVRELFNEHPDIPTRIKRHYTNTDWHQVMDGAAFLEAMAVTPTSRRRGVGSALAGYRIERAQRSGCRAVFVTCVEGTGSADLYDKLGFERIIEMSPYYGDGSGVVFMGRVLGQAG